MAYEIYIANYGGSTVYKLPSLPSEFPELSKESYNETFQTYNDGVYNFIDYEGLLEFTLELWLPRISSNYSFTKSDINAKEIIDLIENSRSNKEAIKITMNNKEGKYVNDYFSIEKFNPKQLKNGDYNISLQVKQWRNYNNTISTTYAVGWAEDSTGWYYYTDTSGNYYKSSWQLINNEWYYFNGQGYALQSTWFQDGATWYYLKDDCKMARNETLTIDGTDYTFDSTGAME
jgi:glucan-binding YG repeat protein